MQLLVLHGYALLFLTPFELGSMLLVLPSFPTHRVVAGILGENLVLPEFITRVGALGNRLFSARYPLYSRWLLCLTQGHSVAVSSTLCKGRNALEFAWPFSASNEPLWSSLSLLYIPRLHHLTMLCSHLRPMQDISGFVVINGMLVIISTIIFITIYKALKARKLL